MNEELQQNNSGENQDNRDVQEQEHQDQAAAAGGASSALQRRESDDEVKNDSTSSGDSIASLGTKRLIRVALAMVEAVKGDIGEDSRRRLTELERNQRRLDDQINRPPQIVNVNNHVAPQNGNNIQAVAQAENVAVHQEEVVGDLLFNVPWLQLCVIAVNQAWVLPFWQLILLICVILIRIAVPNTYENENMWAVNILLSVVFILIALSQKVKRGRYDHFEWPLLVIFMEIVVMSYHGVGQFLVNYNYVSNSPHRSKSGIFHVQIPDAVPLIGSMWVGKLFSCIPRAQTYVEGEQFTIEEKKITKLQTMIDTLMENERNLRQRVEVLSETSSLYLDNKDDMYDKLLLAKKEAAQIEEDKKKAIQQILKVFLDLISIINNHYTGGEEEKSQICYEVFIKLYTHAASVLPTNIQCGILLPEAQKAGDCKKQSQETTVVIKEIRTKGAGQARTKGAGQAVEEDL